jgi:hypothetical protein
LIQGQRLRNGGTERTDRLRAPMAKRRSLQAFPARNSRSPGFLYSRGIPMLQTFHRVLALVLISQVGLVAPVQRVLAETPSERGGPSAGLPLATIRGDGALSIPVGTAPPGSPVIFYIEGYSVGTVTAEADGSAALAHPLYPPSAGAVVTYGALRISPAVTAPEPKIPPFSRYSNILTKSNDLAAWSRTKAVGSNTDNVNGQVVTGGIASGSSDKPNFISLSPTLQAGTYIFGATVVRTAGMGGLQARAYYPTYAQPESNPVFVDKKPVRVSVTFTVEEAHAGRPQSVALTGNLLDGSTSDSTFKVYNVVLAGGAVDPYTAADPPQHNPPKPPVTDYAAQFLTTTNWPTRLPPAVADAQPSGTLRLAARAINLVSIDFTSTGNVKDRATFDSMTFPTGMTGDLTTVIGDGLSNAVDGASATKSYARYRRFPPGHPFDLHVFTPEGLKLGVVGAKNNESPFSGPAIGTKVQVYAGGFRLEQPILPGMTVERVVKFGSNPLSWNCIWMFVGTQISPARYAIAKNLPAVANAPYHYGVNKPGALVYTAQHTVKGVTKSPYYEIDDHDAWWMKPLGHYLQGIPAGAVRPDDATDSDAMQVPPYTYFLPADNGFVWEPGQKSAKLLTSLNDGKFHSVVVNWPDDGSNRIQFIIDGKLFMEQHFEYDINTYEDPLTGTVQKVGMHLLIGGQSIPAFVTDGQGGPIAVPDRDSLAMTVKSIKVWKGNLDETSIVKPTNALIPRYNALTAISPLAGSVGSTVAFTVGGKQQNGTKLTATASDATPLTVEGVLVTGTFTKSGTKTIAVTEHPFAMKGVGLGVPRTTTFTVTVVPSRGRGKE